MAKRRAPRRPRPDPNLLGSEEQDWQWWPTLSATWKGLSEEEIDAAHRRAQQLVEGGWGSVDWGSAD
ncbi:MAG: hypothetical protein RLZZ631_1282 [Cyanobacteriota bacterium]|jgi:transposase InsO family protein